MSEQAVAPVAGDERLPGRRALDEESCIALLREVGWGVLTVVEHSRDGTVPVGVPVAYAHDGERLYLAMAPGRKRSALEGDPHLCLTVTDVRAFECWRSVVVIGRAQWLATPAERARAVAAFAAQPRFDGHRLTNRDAARLVRSRLLVVEPDETRGYESATVTPPAASGIGAGGAAALAGRSARGRAFPEPPDVAMADAAHAHAVSSMDAVRRIVRSLRVAEGNHGASRGVSAAQLFVLREIRKAGVITVGELARRTATSQSSVSEVIARLAARGLVVRGVASTDRRRAALTLAPEGSALLEAAPETVQERLLSGFQRLSPEQQLAVAAGLEAWIDQSGLGDQAATMFFEPLLDGN